MNELKIWDYEGCAIRTVDVDGELWFVGKDVAEALGYVNTRDALAKHVDCEDKNTVAIHDGIGNPNTILINESGLYSLILSSKLPTAKKFKRWVTSEVLPSIRQKGYYGSIPNLESIIASAVTAAVTETVKAITPYIMGSSDLSQYETAVSEKRTDLQEDTRLRRIKDGKIARLDPELRAIVDDMLLSRKYRYVDIKAFLCTQGISISIAAIGKYKNTLYEK